MIIVSIIFSVLIICNVGISFWWLVKSEEQQNEIRYEMAKWLH